MGSRLYLPGVDWKVWPSQVCLKVHIMSRLQYRYGIFTWGCLEGVAQPSLSIVAGILDIVGTDTGGAGTKDSTPLPNTRLTNEFRAGGQRYEGRAGSPPPGALRSYRGKRNIFPKSPNLSHNPAELIR